ncbi:beta-ketoacyl synthase N-terminal-like domain-containing protein, partial [Streptomyces sp. NPDC020875]|uniref:type I polyketide synthase n=1 Tax=Streptomyces sp. NPDC020875 TaxID=3154898 RepID=UPI0033DAF74B
MKAQDGTEARHTRDPRDERIAVTGIACRLPMAPDPAAFWSLLRSGSHAITDVPEGRWDIPQDSAADAGTRRGGFLDDPGLFDAAFFGISPREAVAMDPQQRIVLELAWQALEDAGVLPESLRGSRTGVFVGSLRDDYASLIHRHGSDAITRHTMTGASRGVIANRISYHLGLRGPSLTVDSAQSSSLVAVHLACESLRSGESETAVVAGVNLNILTESALAEERFGGLSPDGRCYTFDARANGFVRGEGAVALLLKPLGRALADGDRVLGVISGSATNNDGATDGLTVPSAGAQEEVLRRAYDNAGIAPEAVQYVELHGTGTRVGDPVEAAALGAVFGPDRSPGAPLLVGSAKTNVGHLEGAAGLVGLLKVLLSLRHRELPPSLNYASPNPGIPMDELGLAVQRTLTPWPRPDRPLIAGVSSFGMGGTNCHVVVEEAELQEEPAAGPGSDADAEGVVGGGVMPLVLSGGTPGGVRGVAGGLVPLVEGGADIRAVADGLLRSRALLGWRGVVAGADRDEWVSKLNALAAEGAAPGAVIGSGPVTEKPRVVFVFPGQGHQWAGMAVGLLDSSVVFAERL